MCCMLIFKEWFFHNKEWKRLKKPFFSNDNINYIKIRLILSDSSFLSMNKR